MDNKSIEEKRKERKLELQKMLQDTPIVVKKLPSKAPQKLNAPSGIVRYKTLTKEQEEKFFARRDGLKSTSRVRRRRRDNIDESKLIKLNTKKRDLATVSQIQAELQAKRKQKQVSLGKEEKITAKKYESVHEVRQKPKESLQELKKNDPEQYYKQNYSSVISKLFKIDKRRFDDDDDDDRDMESSAADIRREEARSARIAKKEELEEELRLKRRNK